MERKARFNKDDLQQAIDALDTFDYITTNYENKLLARMEMMPNIIVSYLIEENTLWVGLQLGNEEKCVWSDYVPADVDINNQAAVIQFAGNKIAEYYMTATATTVLCQSDDFCNCGCNST